MAHFTYEIGLTCYRGIRGALLKFASIENRLYDKAHQFYVAQLRSDSTIESLPGARCWIF